MLRKNLFVLGAALSALSLSACNEVTPTQDSEPVLESRAQNNNAQFFCQTPIAGGRTTIEAEFPENCENCSLAAAGNVISGSPNRAGLLQVQLEGGESSKVRVTAQPGVVFPLGSRAGAMFRFAGGGEGSNVLNTPQWRVVVRAYMDEQLVADETLGTGSSFRRGHFDDDNKLYIYTTPLQEFNTVEFEFSNELGSLNQRAEVYELCADL